ncbi:facilitated trehalose transporter Tret1-like [Prorops nasuta]|uniref:facilitated trehalose transporter Tret1-like n=1 Tax=Prorops nasuta TaxID=863751 RepID=UPI0034CE182F
MPGIFTKAILSQVLVSSVASFPRLIAGMAMGWPTPMISRLTDPAVKDRLTSNEIGWIVSAMTIGGFIGSLLAANILSNRTSQKLILFLSMLPLIISYALTAYLPTFTCLMFARILCGASGRISAGALSIYLGETTENRIRGVMNAISTIVFNIGIIYSYVLGPRVDPRTFSLASGGPAIILSVFILMIPESPYYLIQLGDTRGARNSMRFLRGGADVSEEILQITKYVTNNKDRSSTFKELIMNKVNRKSMIICMLVNFSIVSSGLQPLQMYAERVFNESGFKLSSNDCIIILGIVMLLANLANLIVIDWLGRQTMFSLSGITTCICLLILGIFYHLKYLDWNVSSVNWIPLISFLAFTITLNVGSMPLYSVLLSEIFTGNIKAIAISAQQIITAFAALLSLKLFQIVRDYCGLQISLYLCAFFTLFFTVIASIVIPETKGKSFQEIEDMLGDHKYSSIELKSNVACPLKD